MSHPGTPAPAVTDIDIILAILARALSATTGEEFFTTLTMQLHRLLGCADVMLARLIDEAPPRIASLARVVDGESEGAIELILRDDSPAKSVLMGQTRVFQGNLQTLYPGVGWWREHGLTSYIGWPITGSNGKTLGIITLIDRQPFPDPSRVESLLQIFAGRIAAELERHGATLALEQSEQRLRQALLAARFGTWEWDPHSDRVRINDPADVGFQHSFDDEHATMESLIGRRTPEDAARFRATLDRAVLTGQEIGLEYGNLDARGNLRWFETVGRVEHNLDLGGSSSVVRGVIWEITERRRRDEALISLAGSAAGRHFDRFVHDTLAKLGELYGVGTVTVTRLETGLPPRIRSLECWSRDGIVKPRDSALIGTPEERAITSRSTLHVDDAMAQFKRDEWCQQLGANGYVVLPLLNSAGVAFGALSLADPHAIDLSEESRALLRVFAARLATEIERHEANIIIAEQARMLARIREAIFVIDPDGLIRNCNPGAERTFGYSRGELDGTAVVNLLVAEEQAQLTERVLVPLEQQGHVEREIRFRRKDGAEIIGLASITALTDAEGCSLGQIATVINITRRHHAEKELRALNAELEAFSYSVSHDLRAPLRGIDGFGQALEEECQDGLSDNGREYLKRIRTNSQHMLRLINDLLSLSQLGRADLRSVPVDLSALAMEIVQRLSEQSPQRNVTVTIAPGINACGDPGLLAVALENLFSNAWKYTAQRAVAEIVFDVATRDDAKVYCIRDNGAGFDMQYADKLFRPFQRLHEAKEFEGYGIGLATVHRIISRHGGRIWAESAPGQGARFYFTLPDK